MSSWPCRLRDGPEHRVPWAALGAWEVYGDPDSAVSDVLQGLLAGTGARAAITWELRAGEWHPRSWSGLFSSPRPTSGELSDHPLVGGIAYLVRGNSRYGALTLDRTVHDERRELPLREAAACVQLLDELSQLRHRVDAQSRWTSRLGGEARVAQERLALVRDVERRRSSMEIISVSTARLTSLGEETRLLERLSAQGLRPGVTALHPLRALLEGVIADFRVLVRGIRPLVLETRGARAALTSIASESSRPVHLTGEVPVRMDAELGAALYYLLASGLRLMSDSGGADAYLSTPFSPPPRDALDDGFDKGLVVTLRHDRDRLVTTLRGSTAVDAATLRAALTVDADRIAALDGEVQVSTYGDEILVSASLPDRLQPPDRPEVQGAPPPLRHQVRSLVVSLIADGEADEDAEDDLYRMALTLLSRLDGPIRLNAGTMTSRRPEVVAAVQWLPDVVLVSDATDADAELSAAPVGGESVDVRLVGGGVLARVPDWTGIRTVLADEVVARADLLRSRSTLKALAHALDTVTYPASRLQKLAFEVERVSVGALELAELETIAQMRSGVRGLPRGVARSAQRLLGADGGSVHERLNISPTAEPEEIARAAEEQLIRWRRMSDNPSTAGRQRDVCSVVIRRCEALLSANGRPR